MVALHAVVGMRIRVIVARGLDLDMELLSLNNRLAIQILQVIF